MKRVDSDYIDPGVRKAYQKATMIAIVGNAALLVGKGAASLHSNSSAIYADAANSAADLAYSLLMLIGLWLALRPADESHPHGHRRIEPLVSLGIGLMMALAGIEAARYAFGAWASGPLAVTSLWAVFAPLGTAAAKSGMYLKSRNLGMRAKSPALLAAARDHLSDVVSSGVALAGVLTNRIGFRLGDPLGALFVSVWILYNARLVLAESFRDLTGGAASQKVQGQVIAAATSISDVADVHQVIIEHVGPLVRADIHISMESSTPLTKVHQVCEKVTLAVEGLPEVDHAYVHVEPLGLDEDT